MRLTILFLLIGIGISHATATYSQSTHLSISMKNKTVKEVFSEIEKNSEYIFFYYDDALDTNRKVNIKVDKQTVDKILDQLFESTNSTYVIEDRQIFITRKEPTAKAGAIQQQSRTVTGTVLDDMNEPLIGVNIIIKGTSSGTVTDIDGNYSIDVPDNNAVLIFSFIGYDTQEIPVRSQTKINIILNENSQHLEEIVTIGYGTARKSDLSTAISTVKIDQTLKSRPASITGVLQGRVPGVTIQQSGGDPVNSATVNIRGKGSRNGDGVYWIVDGVPNAPYSFEDVESVTVLKDAASAAIYGAFAGSGGVVVITTKKAQAGKVKVDINVSHGFRNAWKLPQSLTAEEYCMVWKDAIDASSTGKALPIVADPSRYPYGNVTRTDWIDEVFRTGHAQHYALSLSGGTETLKTLVSFAYDKTEGTLLNTYTESLNAKLMQEYQVTKWLKFSERLSISHSKSQGGVNTNSHHGVLLGAIFYPRSATVYEHNQDGSLVLDGEGNRVFGGTIPQWAIDEGISGYGEIRNPVATLKRLNTNSPRANIYSTSTVEIKPITQLTIKSDLTAALIPTYTMNNTLMVPEYGYPSATNSRYVSSEWNQLLLWESTIAYSEVFGEHHISGIVGFTTQKNDWKNHSISVNNFQRENDHYMIIGNHMSTTPTLSETIREESSVSAFGRIGYSYDDRYFATASIRRDATSKLHPDNNWDVFPAFSASWKISSESFFNSEVINMLKLRGSWGQIGNKDLVPNYSYIANLASVKQDRPVVLGVNMDQLHKEGLYMKTMVNPNLKWETTEQTALGLDVEAFDQSLTLSVDYFYKLTKDLIDNIPVPSVAGIEVEPYGNVGKVLNKGWEFSAGYTGRINDFKYNVFGNLSTVKNEVKNIGDREELMHSYTINGITPLYSKAGEPWYSYKVIKTDGLFQTQAEIDNYVNKEGNKIQPNALPGDLKFIDANGDGIISDNDRQYAGSYLPKVTYSFGGGFEYKGFDFNFFLQGVSGLKIFNGFKYMGLTGRYQTNNAWNEILNSWTYNKKSGQPRLSVAEDLNGNYATCSDYFLESGNYLRLKNVTIGYSVPDNFFKAMGAKNMRLRLYVSSENLFTITDYSGFDPEVTNNGVDGGTYPVPRSFSIGLNLNF